MKKIRKIEAKKSVSKQRKIRVAAYVRVSTSFSHQLDSFDAQYKHYKNLIESRYDWENKGIYCDEGISGTSLDRREGLNRLLAACRAGEIDLILTKSISRFARNLTDCLKLVRELNSLGVAIHFDRENINTQEMDSELILTILASIAEAESVSISQNQSWALRKRVENGTYKHMVAAYGYDLDDGKLVINEEKAKVVKSIFNMYLSGKGCFRIAKELNKQGIKPSRNAESWKASVVTEILKNERYVGDFLYQKTYTTDRFEKKRNRNNVDMLYIPDDHPAIIDRKDFNKAQELMAIRAKNHETTVNKVYPFTSKINCQRCGANFIRRTHLSTNNRDTHAWACANTLKGKKYCGIKFINEHVLEGLFMTMLNKLKFARAEIIEESIAKHKMEKLKNNIDLIDVINGQIRDIEKNIHKAAELFGKKLISHSIYLEEKQNLDNEKSNLLAERRKLSTEDKVKSTHLNELNKLNSFLLETDYLTEYDPELFERFVNRILVYEDTYIGFEMKCGLIFRERW